MMKLNKAITVSVLALSLLVPGIAQAQDMKPMQSNSITMMDQSKMMNMKELVPLRMFAETLGYTIMWNKEERSITLTFMGKGMDMGMSGDMSNMDMDNMNMNMGKDMYTIKLMLDSKSAMIGMDNQMLDQAPMLMDGKVYISKEVVMKYLLAPYMMKSM